MRHPFYMRAPTRRRSIVMGQTPDSCPQNTRIMQGVARLAGSLGGLYLGVVKSKGKSTGWRFGYALGGYLVGGIAGGMTGIFVFPCP